MTQPISIDRLEFIEVDGLKIRFQRNRVEGGIPCRAHEPLAGELVRLPADLADPWRRGLPYCIRPPGLWPIGKADAIDVAPGKRFH
jgi:hypothetical protein